jgi:hypothetical protein
MRARLGGTSLQSQFMGDRGRRNTRSEVSLGKKYKTRSAKQN